MKTITFSILSTEGDTTVTLNPTQALERMRTEVEQNHKWLYVGQTYRDPNTLTVDELLATDESIVLTNALVGG